MAADEPCHLLRIPRELRNAIYSGINRETFLTADSRDLNVTSVLKGKPIISLMNSLDPGLLRTCKTIHDEYSEVWADNLDLKSWLSMTCPWHWTRRHPQVFPSQQTSQGQNMHAHHCVFQLV